MAGTIELVKYHALWDLVNLEELLKNGKFLISNKDLNNSNQKNFDEISHSIEESIDLHLNRDVPLSTLLSSGLDSSLITYLSRKKEDSIFGLTVKSM